MANQLNKSILLLDDDHIFRQLLVDLLTSKGLTVIEAHSGKEADAILTAGEPACVIVDYRLPHCGGLAWISSVREAGRKFPIVFLTGIPLDAHTFNLLRNILRVTLILNKPVMPELFFDQLMSILGDVLPVQSGRYIALPSAHTNERPGTTGSQSADFVSQASSSEASSRAWKVMSGAANEDAFARVRSDYLRNVNQSWQELDNAICSVREEPGTIEFRQGAIEMAHKIRGTAGSLGFKQIGEAAGIIEDSLSAENCSDSKAEQMWSRIAEALSLGATSIRDKNEENGVAAKQLTNDGGRVYAIA